MVEQWTEMIDKSGDTCFCKTCLHDISRLAFIQTLVTGKHKSQ